MFTEHAFPRHSHDHFGIGLMTSGAQRSWSLIGNVESEAGDVIMVNPGEMHDGAPIGRVRSWRIIYLDPALVAREIANDSVNGGEPLRCTRPTLGRARYAVIQTIGESGPGQHACGAELAVLSHARSAETWN